MFSTLVLPPLRLPRVLFHLLDIDHIEVIILNAGTDNIVILHLQRHASAPKSASGPYSHSMEDGHLAG